MSNSPNFSSSLMSQQIDDVPKPTVLPTGKEYAGVVKSHEFRKTQGDKPQKILTYVVKFTDWSPEVQDVDKMGADGHPIDITTKSSRMDFFYESESGGYALAQFLKSCGLKGSVEECIPRAVGANVVCAGEQKFVEKTNDIVFNLKKVSGTA